MMFINVLVLILAIVGVFAAFEFGKVAGEVETLTYVHYTNSETYNTIRKVYIDLRDNWLTGIDSFKYDMIVGWTDMAVNKYKLLVENCKKSEEDLE